MIDYWRGLAQQKNGKNKLRGVVSVWTETCWALNRKVRLTLSKKKHLKGKRVSRAVIGGKRAPGGGNSLRKGLQAGRGPGVATNRKSKRRPTLCCAKNSMQGDTGGNVHWCSHYREEYGGSLKNWRQSYHTVLQSLSWAYIQRKP